MKLLNHTCALTVLIVVLSGCSQVASKTSPTNRSESAVGQSPLADTGKIRSDLNDLVNSISSGKPDTNKLKAAASDILSKDASILSDSGIDKLTGQDPSAKEAGTILKKIRNASGLTPGALDSLKKVAASLGQ